MNSGLADSCSYLEPHVKISDLGHLKGRARRWRVKKRKVYCVPRLVQGDARGSSQLFQFSILKGLFPMDEFWDISGRGERSQVIDWPTPLNRCVYILYCTFKESAKTSAYPDCFRRWVEPLINSKQEEIINERGRDGLLLFFLLCCYTLRWPSHLL